MNPAFREEKIELEKSRMIESIKRKADNPRQVVAEEFLKLVYPEHPYGNKETEECIQTITRDDIAAFHQNYFSVSNIIMGVSGDFDKEEIVKEINSVFRVFKKKKVNFPVLPELKRNYKRSVNLIEKETNQSCINIGHIGVERTHPNYFPIVLMNSLLARRVYESVRKFHGLAYVASAYFVFYEDLGYFVATTQTKSATTCKAISFILDEMKKIRKEKVQENELEILKESVLNGFVFQFEEARDIVARYINIEYKGLPKDYLITYRDKVIEVTPEDIIRVANEYLHPDQTIILVLGDSDKFEEPLTTFGEVNIIK